MRTPATIKRGASEASPAASFEQAKKPVAGTAVFTNCGNAGKQERPVKRAQVKKLARVPFLVSRLMEFCTERELVNQTGHNTWDWPLVILKELTDNSLDACEETEVAPVITVAVTGTTIVIADNGPGFAAATIAGVLNYGVRVSSRAAYCSPTRGAQGNALKTILPMAYVLDEGRGEAASGATIIEANGVAHHITFAVDHIRQEPKIAHATKGSRVVRGTRITIELPAARDYGRSDRGVDVVEFCKYDFLQLAAAYAWLNPHLTITVSWNGEQLMDIKATNPAWAKWLPSWPTSAHWYDSGRFRRYMAAHIAHRGDITVREFISEFRGMSATAKQKDVLAEIGASHVSLHRFFGANKVNTGNIARLLASLKRHSKPVPPAQLGVIGRDHFFRRMEAAGGDPSTFTYEQRLGETGGVPRVVEYAFGLHRAAFAAARGPRGKIITGVNWSPGINNPFRQIGRSGDGLDAILEQVRASTSQPVIVALHVACARVTYTDRGKSAIVVEGEADGGDDGEET
jgi:hypothetical protein